jgi:GntR family transcriptional regulator, transcriptional repressor for pyruvate dehydrogenase complex
MAGEVSGASSIFRVLLEDISAGRLKPGDSLGSEHALMQRFGVSRTMVRDATAMLAGLGAVDRARGRTGVVQRVDGAALSQLFPLMLRLSGLESLRDVYDLRILIESEAAALASRRGSEEQLEEIRAFAASYEEAQRDRDPGSEHVEGSGFISDDVRFHGAVALASGNAMLARLLDVLTAFLRHVQIESCRDDVLRSRDASREHTRIVDAIFARDPDAARIEMSHHLRVSREALERRLRDRIP